MYQRFLSWRFLLRRPINLIGVVGITIGVGALIMIISIMSGFLEQSRQTVRGSLADVIVQPPSIPLRDGYTPPTAAEPLLEVLRADPRVAGACPRLSWGGMVVQTTDRQSELHAELILKDPDRADVAFAQFVGIDLEDEVTTTEFRSWLERESDYRHPVANVDDPFSPPASWTGDAPWDWVVVGEQLARAHLLRRGSLVDLVTGVPDSQADETCLSNRKFLVAGTFRSGDNETDRTTIYLDRRELSDFLGRTQEFTQVLVRLVDYERDRETIERGLLDELAAEGLLDPGYPSQVRTWETFKGSLIGAIENERVLMGIMLCLVILVAAFTVFAILMMMVTEKRRDIGILTALGATRRSILSIFLLIGLWNAVLGSSFGALLGVWGALRIDALEQWLSRTFGVQIFNRDVYIFDHIPSEVSPKVVVATVVGALVATAVFSLIPAWLASRTHPIDALRTE